MAAAIIARPVHGLTHCCNGTDDGELDCRLKKVMGLSLGCSGLECEACARRNQIKSEHIKRSLPGNLPQCQEAANSHMAYAVG